MGTRSRCGYNERERWQMSDSQEQCVEGAFLSPPSQGGESWIAKAALSKTG
jgi:hypothetical protein